MAEADIIAGRAGKVPDKPLTALLDRYAEEVSATRRGEKWERLRLALIGRDEIGAVRLPALNATHFAAWCDRRLRQVSAASVRREWTPLSHACAIAVREWCRLTENPMKLVRRPAYRTQSPHQPGGNRPASVAPRYFGVPNGSLAIPSLPPTLTFCALALPPKAILNAVPADVCALPMRSLGK